jgi:hypothetical protein
MRTIGKMLAYRLQWTMSLGAITAVFVGWTAWRALAERYPGANRKVIAPIALAGVAVLSGTNTIDAVRAREPDEPSSLIVAALIPQVTHALPARRGDVLIKGFDTWYMPALLLALERHGMPARVERDPFHLFGDADTRVQRGGRVRAVLRIGAETQFDEFVARSDLRLIAYWGTLSVSDRAKRLVQIEGMHRPIDEAYASGRITKQEWLRRLSRLPTGSTAVGVFIERSP